MFVSATAAAAAAINLSIRTGRKKLINCN